MCFGRIDFFMFDYFVSAYFFHLLNDYAVSLLAGSTIADASKDFDVFTFPATNAIVFFSLFHFFKPPSICLFLVTSFCF